MDFRLAGKRALITGASRGLGAATAHVLAEEGASLLLAARDEERLSRLAHTLTDKHGIAAHIYMTDLTSPGAGDLLVAHANEKLGRIDIVVNAAGASQGGIFWEIEDQVWEESFALKVMGTIRVLRAAAPVMIEQSYGRIVSIVGNTGLQPNPRMLPGAAANAALLAVTRGLAPELAPYDVVINAVNPGPTRTKRWTGLMDAAAKRSGRTVAQEEADYLKDIPLGRINEPHEVARLVAFLASDAAAPITGTSITADGGWTKGIG